jgi:hypothetical protein
MLDLYCVSAGANDTPGRNQMRIFTYLFLTVWLLSTPVVAQDALRIGKGDFIFDVDPRFIISGRDIPLDPLFSENPGAEIVSGIIDLHPDQKPPFVVRTSQNLNNAFAVIHKGQRYIVYDYGWTAAGEYTAGHILVLGHEVGHHVCGHTAGSMRSDPHGRELEADRYAGASLRRMQSTLSLTVSLQDIVQAAQQLFPVEDSPTHPGAAKRINAIIQGYNSGSPCELNTFTQPENYTEAEKRAMIEKAKSENMKWCLEIAQDFCKATDITDKKFKHLMMHDNCEVDNSFTYSNPPYKEVYMAFPGVDCIGGGRYQKKGISTSIRVR